MTQFHKGLFSHAAEAARDAQQEAARLRQQISDAEQLAAIRANKDLLNVELSDVHREG